jgi:hypothetical protein
MSYTTFPYIPLNTDYIKNALNLKAPKLNKSNYLLQTSQKIAPKSAGYFQRWNTCKDNSIEFTYQSVWQQLKTNYRKALKKEKYVNKDVNIHGQEKERHK